MSSVKITDRQIDVIRNSPIVVVIDTETTGFSSVSSLIEIGAIKIDTVHKKGISTFSTLIFPDLGYLNKKAEAVNQIHWDDVKDAPQLETVMLQFSEFIQDFPCVMHNAAFDWTRFLDPGLKKVGRIHHNEILDTKEMLRYLHPDLGHYTLSDLTAFYGNPIPEDEHHRAIVDAKYTASAYLRMCNEFQALPEVNSETMLEDSSTTPYFDMRNFRIIRVNPWSKGSRERRVYVRTTAGVFVFDYKRNTWSVSELGNYQVNLYECATEILRLCHASSEQDLYQEKMIA